MKSFKTIIFLLFSVCLHSQEIVNLKIDSNFEAEITYNSTISIFDTIPLKLKLKNNGKPPIKFKSLGIRGGIRKIKKPDNQSAATSIFVFMQHNKLLTEQPYSLQEKFNVGLLQEISQVYLSNKKKYPGTIPFKKKAVVDSIAYLHLRLDITYDNKEKIEKFIEFPITVKSIKSWSSFDEFFYNQFNKYKDTYYASTYLSFIIQNEEFLRHISTNSLISCITGIKHYINITTKENEYLILTEIKKRNLEEYNKLYDLGYSKSKYFKKYWLPHVNNLCYRELYRGINPEFEWDNEYFLTITDAYEKGELRDNPQNLLNHYRSKWKNNIELVKKYNSLFK